MGMALYSLLLLGVFVVGAPYWLVRMFFSSNDRGRYRAGLGGRLGRVPRELREAVAGKRVVWVHAVSVGEVLAATRLVAELEALGAGWVIVISTTTATGQGLARERFGAERVFWYPLDFAWAVRAYLNALQPKMLVLMESELWPRMLVECRRMAVPVAVVNARVSDRSFARTMRVQKLWQRMARHVTLWLAQSKEDAHRLEFLGVESRRIETPGNLKFDIRAPRHSHMADLIRKIAAGRPVLVAGSTLEGEEEIVVWAWMGTMRAEQDMLLVLAPRHPERFERAYSIASAHAVIRATELINFADSGANPGKVDIVVLNTLGDLAGVYEVATIAFVGGSMVPRGGHNPLEPAQFGVPIIMGTSWENFKDIVYRLRSGGGMVTLPYDDVGHLVGELRALLLQPDYMRRMGEQAKLVFEQEQGATGRVVEALVGLVKR
jgi:3-deoxy-D-manno-octulosonic-acid transferase